MNHKMSTVSLVLPLAAHEDVKALVAAGHPLASAMWRVLVRALASDDPISPVLAPAGETEKRTFRIPRALGVALSAYARRLGVRQSDVLRYCLFEVLRATPASRAPASRKSRKPAAPPRKAGERKARKLVIRHARYSIYTKSVDAARADAANRVAVTILFDRKYDYIPWGLRNRLRHNGMRRRLNQWHGWLRPDAAADIADVVSRYDGVLTISPAAAENPG